MRERDAGSSGAPLDRGLTHVALAVSDLARSLDFYERYAGLTPVHRREDAAWISDGTRPFVLVLIETADVGRALGPFSHLGVAFDDRARFDELVELARREGLLTKGPIESGPPVGTWAFLDDPDGHVLELSIGQDVAGAVSSTFGSDLGSALDGTPALRRRVVAVVGSGSEEHAAIAEPLGAGLARLGVDLVTGGGAGVMAAAARAFVGALAPDRRGRSIGILPADPDDPARPAAGYPNDSVEIVLPTHLAARGARGGDSDSRSHLVVRAATCVVALPGGAGTSSEIAIARSLGIPSCTLLAGAPDSTIVTSESGERDPVDDVCHDPASALAWVESRIT